MALLVVRAQFINVTTCLAINLYVISGDCRWFSTPVVVAGILPLIHPSEFTFATAMAPSPGPLSVQMESRPECKSSPARRDDRVNWWGRGSGGIQWSCWNASFAIFLMEAHDSTPWVKHKGQYFSDLVYLVCAVIFK
jgi:hypothetical protein